MRKAYFLGVVASLVMPAIAFAQDGRIYYGSGPDHGTNIEFPNFNMRINALIRTGYNYIDYDEQALRGLEDASDFAFDAGRIAVTGDALDGRLGYRLEHDFADDSETPEVDESGLKDAYVEYRLSEWANVRWGQFRTAYSRQRNVDRWKLQFVDRTFVTDFQTGDRDRGGMLHGGNEQWGYKVGVFNGQSSNEGPNRRGVDNRVRGSFGAHYNLGEFGNRNEEGDHREGDKPLAGTFGVGLDYGQASIGGVDIDRTNLSVDAGIRVAGLSWSIEYLMDDIDPDGGQSVQDDGLYTQIGYLFGDYEGALRFGYIDPDNQLIGQVVDSFYEYAFVVSKFFDGHNIKLQNQISFRDFDNEPVEGNDTDFSDFRYDLLVTAYL